MHLLERRRIPWILAPIVALALLAASIPMTASAATLSVGTSPLAVGEVGVAYSQTVTATGGTGPYTWSIPSGLPPGLSLNTSTGVISGTPTTTGTFAFTATVTDFTSATASAALFITVVPMPATLTVTTASLAGGTVGVSYSQTLAATGGVTPYSWSISSGTLPAGLSLNASTGVISGTPTAAATSSFTVMVTDAAAHTATSASLSIVVGPAATLTITTSSLPGGTVGVTYSATLMASGGIGPDTWTISSGTLPTGLSLTASTGVISGTPTTAGTSTFEATVHDSASHVASATLSIVVSPTGTLTVTTTSLPSGTVGVAYSATLMASGGTGPDTWSTSGSLPGGLTLNASTGLISGTPTAAGTFSFTATVNDSASHTASMGLSIVIGPAATLAVTTTSLPGGVVGVAYSATLMATGGVTPYTWSISGSLPTGLSLNASTGVISGTPTTAGTFTFAVTVTDSASHMATKALSITISSTPPPPPSEAHGFHGLCVAFFAGSATGREHKAMSPAFQQLIHAAGADGKSGSDLDTMVHQFCSLHDQD